jgi:hypothetical protein
MMQQKEGTNDTRQPDVMMKEQNGESRTTTTRTSKTPARIRTRSRTEIW